MRRAPPMPEDVARAFASYTPAARRMLKSMRRLVYHVAASVEGVGPLEETLKWGEPAYLTSKSGSGTTIRLGWKPKTPKACYLYVHCQTDLIPTFRSLFGDELRFEGNRAIAFSLDEPLPEAPLAYCVEAALTYHRRKKR